MKLSICPLRLTVAVILIGIVSISNALAQSSTRVAVLRNAKAVMNYDVPATQRLARSGGKGWRSAALRFNVQIFGEGIVAVKFDRLRKRDWSAHFIDGAGNRSEDTTETILTRGTATGRARDRTPGEKRLRIQPIAGIVTQRGNERKVEFYLNGQGVNGHKRYLKVIARLRSDRQQLRVRVSRAPDFALAGMECSDGGAPVSAAANFNGGQANIPPMQSVMVSSTAVLYSKIAMEADHLFHAAFGQDSAAELASILNVVDGIYRSDLALAFELGATTIRTSSSSYPAGLSDAEDLLNHFQSMSLADSERPLTDLYHLMTGRDMDGSTVGLAYVGVVCSAVEFGYGLSQYTNESLTPIISAHEIGHNFGAEHVSNGIMMTSLGDPIPTNFSSQSLSQINSYVSQNSQCLNYEDGSSVPGNKSPVIALRASLSGANFKARIDIASVADGCVITLNGAPTSAKAKGGRTIFSVAPSGTRLIARAKMNRRTFNGASVYLVAGYSCPGLSTSYSKIKVLQPTNKKLGKAVTVGAWLNSLRALFVQ